MTLSLYSTYRAWRRDVAAERKVAARQTVDSSGFSLYDTVARLGLGLAGIACGGDTAEPGATGRRL